MPRILLILAIVLPMATAVAQEAPPPLPPSSIPPLGPAGPSSPENPPSPPPVLNTPTGRTVAPPWQSSPESEVPRSPQSAEPVASSSRVETATSQTAMVSVEVVSPETANIGAPVSQEIVVRNHGRSPVYHVRVEAELSSGAKYAGGEPRGEVPGDRLHWTFGVLEAGSEKRIRSLVQTNDEGTLRCRAAATWSTIGAAATRMTRPKLAVSINGPDSVLVGEAAVFQIKLSNSGTGAIQKLVLRDRLPEGLQHPAGPVLEAEVAGLAPGETRTVTLRTTATKVGSFTHEIQAFADGHQINNIQLAGGTRNPDLEAAARTEVRVVEPGLQIRLTGPKACLVKCDGVLTIDLMNPGTAPTRNIRLAAKLPDGMEFVALSEEGSFDPATRTANWNVPVLDAGGHRVLTLKARGVTLGEGACVAVAQAEGGLAAKAELPVRIEGVPALSLEVIDLDDPAPVGTDAVYEIRVLNQGTCPCTGIQIVANMPEGMELREASAPTPYKIAGQQVQFGAFARLATKADLVYRIKVRSKTGGDVRFRVQLTCDQLQQPVFKEESSRFYKQ